MQKKKERQRKLGLKETSSFRKIVKSLSKGYAINLLWGRNRDR